MTTSFTRRVLEEINRIDRGRAEVICESADEEHFGNAHVTLDFNGLRLHVINDRGVATVEVGLSVDALESEDRHPALNEFKDGTGQPTCPLEVLAVSQGWIAFEDLVEHYDLDGERSESFKDSETMVARPFYELVDAMSLLEDKEKWVELVRCVKDEDVHAKAGEIAQKLQERFAATLAE